MGPVQLIVLGFSEPDFHGEIIAELERLHDTGTVRVIDSLVVYKDAAGELEVEHLSNLTRDEAIEVGTKIGALIGLGIDGEEGMEIGAEAGAQAAAEDGVQHLLGGRSVGRSRRHPERQRRRAHPDRAPLGRAAPRRRRACGRVPDLRRLRRPDRSRRDRPAGVRGYRYAHRRQARSRPGELTRRPSGGHR